MQVLDYSLTLWYSAEAYCPGIMFVAFLSDKPIKCVFDDN